MPGRGAAAERRKALLHGPCGGSAAGDGEAHADRRRGQRRNQGIRGGIMSTIATTTSPAATAEPAESRPAYAGGADRPPRRGRDVLGLRGDDRRHVSGRSDLIAGAGWMPREAAIASPTRSCIARI